MKNAFQELLDEFLLEARERADEVEALMLGLAGGDLEQRRDALAQAKRQLHTLKGNSGMMGYGELQRLSHSLEDQVEQLDLDAPKVDAILSRLDGVRRKLEEIRSQELEDEPAEDQAPSSAPAEAAPLDVSGGSVRLSFTRIDELVEMLAETVIHRNRLADVVASGLELADEREDPESLVVRLKNAWEEVEHAHQALEKALNALQEHVTELGMVPLQGLFRSLRRVVHDESAREGKRVEIEAFGDATPIDKALLETAGEALGHLVRNAVIHGIEAPEERLKLGKPESGTLSLKASIESGEVRIEVADDGRGIDLDALRQRAAELGIDAESRELGGFHLMFTEGVSTKTGADLSAGRGVGMSAVKRTVERHGGRMEVDSERGRGSTFLLRLPVTASILRSLLIRVDGEEYALSLAAVIETLKLDAQEIHEVNHAGVLRWRGTAVPLLDLGMAFQTSDRLRTQGYVLVIDINGRVRGLVADEVVGIRDIVVRVLDNVVGQPTGISGSTILGDGRVIMILDPAALATVQPFVATEA